MRQGSSEPVGAIAVLVMLGAIFSLLLGGRGRGFRPATARMRMRRVSGSNAATVLAVVAIATLLVKVSDLPVIASIPSAPAALAASVVVLVLGIVVFRSLTSMIITLFGAFLLVTTVGVAGAVQLGIVIALALWLTGAARGFFAGPS